MTEEDYAYLDQEMAAGRMGQCYSDRGSYYSAADSDVNKPYVAPPPGAEPAYESEEEEEHGPEVDSDGESVEYYGPPEGVSDEGDEYRDEAWGDEVWDEEPIVGAREWETWRITEEMRVNALKRAEVMSESSIVELDVVPRWGIFEKVGVVESVLVLP